MLEKPKRQTRRIHPIRLLLKPTSSFVFTLPRRLGVCVSNLQNASREFNSRKRIEIGSLKDNLFGFTVVLSSRWFPITISGQLTTFDDSSTFVSGEIRQTWHWGIVLYMVGLIFCIAQIAQVWGILALPIGAILIGGFAAYFLWQLRVSTGQALEELTCLLDSDSSRFSRKG